MWDIIFVIMPTICGNFGNLEWPSSLENCQHFQPWHQRKKLGSYLLEIVSMFMFFLLSVMFLNRSVLSHFFFYRFGSGQCRCFIRCSGMYPLPASLSSSARVAKISYFNYIRKISNLYRLYFLFRFKMPILLDLNCLF